MTTLEEAPDLEDLAAYVDGRLAGDQKARVEEHLLHDEDYYEVFMETVYFQEEQAKEASSDDDNVVRWHSKSGTSALVAAAAAMLLITLATYRFLQLQQPSNLVAGLDTSTIITTDNWFDPGWQTMRGGDHITDEQAIAYRVGVRSIDVTVALEARDLDSARSFAGDLLNLAKRAWPLKFHIEDGYELLVEELSVAIEQPELAEFGRLSSTAKRARGRLLLSPRDYPDIRPFIDMGQWTELGRLAALSRDESLFRVAARKAQSWEHSKIKESLNLLETLRKQKTLEPADFENAGSAFENITQALALEQHGSEFYQ